MNLELVFFQSADTLNKFMHREVREKTAKEILQSKNLKQKP